MRKLHAPDCISRRRGICDCDPIDADAAYRLADVFRRMMKASQAAEDDALWGRTPTGDPP